MLVKSRAQLDRLKHLHEVFKLIRRYNLKLNLLKCAFRVKSGNFLGYLVTKRCIEVNSKQLQAMLNMTSPNTNKQIQALT